jgi:hypothetical protein
VARKSRQQSLDPAVPPRVLVIAEELRKRPGVVCVVWGSRKKGKRWYHREACISVHVNKKRDPDRLGKQLLPQTIDGYRVDVVEVGKPKLQALGVRHRVDAGALGRSTATLFATRGADAVALLSGHGTLSGANTRVQVSGGGDTIDGSVGPGDFGKGLSVDFAFATFPRAASNIDTSHPELDGSAPFRLTSGPAPGDRVRLFSTKRGMPVSGVFQGTVLGSVELAGESYTSLFSIASRAGQEPFSVVGDSGSLVVDEEGNAAGAIVGGRPDLAVSYAYDLRRLSSALSAARFALFFEED